ncbi:MAG: lytic transglycosylase domain-containing protein [Desulfobaccales bacterium]
MVRTSMIAAAAGLNRTSSSPMGPAALAGLSRGGTSGFSQMLSQALMTRQDRPRSVSGGRQEFPQALRDMGNAHLSSLLTRSALGHSSSGPGRNLVRTSSSRGSGSEAERLFSSGRSQGGRAVDPQVFEGMIKTASARYQVPEELVKAVIKVESNFNPQATSPVGAMGLMQLMPGTARDLGVQRPYDPRENIDGGTKYLRELLDRYDGNVPMAVAAYNCGMANVEKGRLPQETRSYLQLVSRHYNGSQVLPKARAIPAASDPAPSTAHEISLTST